MGAAAAQGEKLVVRSAVDQDWIKRAQGAVRSERVQGEPHRSFRVLERGEVTDFDPQNAACGCGRFAVGQNRCEPLPPQDIWEGGSHYKMLDETAARQP